MFALRQKLTFVDRMLWSNFEPTSRLVGAAIAPQAWIKLQVEVAHYLAAS
jgi:hypothetical protein